MSIRPWKLIQHLILGFLPFGRRECVACAHRVHGFLPYRGGLKDLPPLIRELEVVGSDVERFECPRCGAHDRERHLLLYLSASGLLSRIGTGRVVHFAPEPRIAKLLREAGGEQYLPCDLHPRTANVAREDLCCMSFESGSVDLLVANHVLEHVPQLDPALTEIYRVLSPGGYAVLQTPFSTALVATWEDSGVATERQRLQAYGQEDHVRLFSSDIFDRIESAGLAFVGGTHTALLPGCNPARFGVNGNEPFMLFRKSQSRALSEARNSM